HSLSLHDALPIYFQLYISYFIFPTSYFQFRISDFHLRKLQKPLPLGWAKGFWSFLLHRNFKYKLHTSYFIFPTLYFKFHISHFVFPISYFRLPFKETPKTFSL